MARKTTRFDIADYLESEADIAEYLSEALDLGDPARHRLDAPNIPEPVTTVPGPRS